jgi:hypothetical protein
MEKNEMRVKAKFQAHVANITRRELEEVLRSIPEFSDFNCWELKHLGIGEMMHTYILSKGNKRYFVKEVKPHEAQANYFLSILGLEHLPTTLYPELLDKKVLVMPFIEGGMMRERKRRIDYGLLHDFIKFQNKMNDKSFFDKYNRLGIHNFGRVDEGFFKGRVVRNLKAGRLNLLKAKRKYHIPIIDKYIEIADFLKPFANKISEEFASMPFARQHHDFREDNIISKRHLLIDWGSSYGYGPFMYDLAIFLIHDKKALNIFIKESNIARKATKEQIKRWLYVALVDRFDDFCKWHLKPGTPNEISKIRLKKVLEYNYKTYEYLLK